MPQMPIASRAQNFHSAHTIAVVCLGPNGVFRSRLEERGPAGAAIELGVRLERRQVAAGAVVDAGLVVVEEGTTKGCFRALLAKDLVLVWGQPLLPLCV